MKKIKESFPIENGWHITIDIKAVGDKVRVTSTMNSSGTLGLRSLIYQSSLKEKLVDFAAQSLLCFFKAMFLHLNSLVCFVRGGSELLPRDFVKVLFCYGVSLLLHLRDSYP